MATDGFIFGIDDVGALAVFGFHAAIGLVLIVLGLLVARQNLIQGVLFGAIGAMIGVVGRSAGRIVSRR
ncbi:MAG: hypothetical protein J07HB67_02209 [halophilic archaeon J07HB67]|jgi:hypothetical protein|nr:MAG: hypothetical protein J07HB67_02209 [halophilic archaeon J07HB67]